MRSGDCRSGEDVERAAYSLQCSAVLWACTLMLAIAAVLLFIGLPAKG
ncbi:MAG: hypothetical protein Q7T87_17445 [Polaromonas sp.]|nr:hypothetical protein [Polaromonas sp.]